jgi:hypothetical protein
MEGVRKTPKYLRIVNVPAGIQTGHLSNTS